ncbi:MAG: ADP-ribosylglycohydrolase family protein [Candidatus Glassbacteria bacterium]
MLKIEHLYIGRDALLTEREQLVDEGRGIEPVQADFERYLSLEDDDLEKLQPELARFLDRTGSLPQRAGYPYDEPSDYAGIRDTRPAGGGCHVRQPGPEIIRDRIYGAWYGRVAGCLLGKPVEGWTGGRIRGYLKDLGRYPLDAYFRADVPAEIAQRYEILPGKAFIDRVDHLPWDDDINYSLAGMLVLKKHGRSFQPLDVTNFWLENLPVLSTWTAERTAYRNLLEGVAPPESAVLRNPYREWIGAQIRADAYGWLAAGNPELAAQWAWRDASVSHVRNGIYGSLWVAAMLAEAPFAGSALEVVEEGLKQIPERCRLAEAVREVIGWHGEGTGWEEAIGRVHERWDEKKPHHWCHTLSNAQIVALGLLWGEGDFEKSICRAVQAGFDTDCNGATVGSVVGMLIGEKFLPAKWIDPLNDTVDTSLAGYQTVKIGELVRECCRLRLELQD